MKQQLVTLRRKLKEEQIDAFVSMMPLVRRYLCGFTGTNGYAVVSEGRLDFLTDFRYLEQSAKECPDFNIVEISKDYHLWDYLREHGLKRIALEEQTMTVDVYEQLRANVPGFEPVYGFELVNAIRQIKTPEEITLHRKSCEMTNAIIAEFFDYVRPGMTEKELNAFILDQVVKHGADNCFFDPITLTGPNSSLCHGKPTDRSVEEGDFILLDMGVNLNGYASDVTRTAVLGKANEKQKEIYSVVLEAHRKAAAEIHVGMTAFEADKIARDVITEAGYGAYFGHALGHGFHDGVVLRNDPQISSLVLKEHMAFTIEPGIYIPGFGGVRIEDDYILTKDGCVSLCTYPKELMELPVS